MMVKNSNSTVNCSDIFIVLETSEVQPTYYTAHFILVIIDFIDVFEASHYE